MSFIHKVGWRSAAWQRLHLLTLERLGSGTARRRLRFVPQGILLEGRVVPSYVFQTIDNPNGVSVNQTESINSSGKIVGVYNDAAGAYHGYVLSGGEYTTIDDPNTGPGQSSFAYTINASGRIVGSYTDAAGQTHGYLLSGGVYTTLDDPNAVHGTFTVGINAPGTIAGLYVDAKNAYHGFLLSGGNYTTYDDPNAGDGPSQGTIIDEINSSGKFVGEYIDSRNVPHGFLFSGGQFTTIDDPNCAPGAYQFAGFINDHGEIAGGYTDAAGTLHGYLLNNGQFTTFDYPNAGPGGSGISGVNNSGTIVGFYYDSAGIEHGYEATPVHGKSDVVLAGTGAGAVSATSSTTAVAPLRAMSRGLPSSSFSLTAGIGRKADGTLPAVPNYTPGSQSGVIAIGALPVYQLGQKLPNALFTDFGFDR
jgi:hypothetical protein